MRLKTERCQKTYFEKEELPLNTLKPISFALKRWDNNPVALSSSPEDFRPP